ncbi:Mycophenolic acid synthesis protein B [Lachnellula suecica]|uniref:Mycophenolic acid synthesis protein B n=1 Tax=Lachnellula suecica TaxID=602035 RepID=A0A8T9C985_9HELO|nr:Mycophenolic acid synthesis protein B [Lachnellula suecica]
MGNSTANIGGAAPPAQASGWAPLIVTLFALYAVLCSYLRFQRRDAMHKKLGFTNGKSLSRMTVIEAQSIVQYLGQLEFPKLYYTSVQFALFKTYGIPTISGLLMATREFSTTENASKRYSDTEILIQEFTFHHPENERVHKAIARMNYIHSGYQKAGKISNADLLYTLSVFITEPITWVKKYEWRSMTDMEICAIGVLWKSIGDAMGIQYEGYLSKSLWKDGLEFYEDISAWAEQYEQKYMVPAESNRKLANELLPLLLFFVPKSAEVAARNIVGCLMGERLCKAMIYPAPTKGFARLASVIFATRAFVLRYLSPPRPEFLRVSHFTDADPKTGRYHWKTYLVQPMYNKPGFMNRWGPEAWFVKAFGGSVPGDKGKTFCPEGYKIEEMGPKGMKKGLAEMKATEQRLKTERPLGCPFAFAA